MATRKNTLDPNDLTPIATIKDVAQRAGVSISTVSHVMNNTRFVEPETRERVLAAMAALHYQPNRLARGLRNQKTHTLGVLLPNSANPFFAEVLHGIEDMCYVSGYSVILGNANDEPAREISHLEVLCSKQIDGVLLISTGAFEEALALLARYDMPTVMVDRSPGGRPIDSIMVDNALGGSLATQHLIALGHRRIGCITGPLTLTPSAERVVGYQQALHAAGLSLDDHLLVTGDFSHEGGYRAAEALLRLPTPPTAIFACNDLMAVGAYRAIHEAGLRLPQQISVVGFDDIPLALYVVPRLTTVAQPAAQLGRLAVEMLIRRCADRLAPIERHMLDVTLISRDSCDVP